MALVISLAAVATAVIFWRQAQENTELAQQQLKQLNGERLLQEARDLKEKCEVQAAIAKSAKQPGQTQA